MLFNPPAEYQPRNLGNGYISWFNRLFMADNKLLAHTRLTEYLLGYDQKGSGRLTGNGENNRLPMLNTPFRRHLNEVNRFLFNGGIRADVVNAKPGDPRQLLIDRLFTKNKINSLIDNLWELGSVTGEVALVFNQTKDAAGNPQSNFVIDTYDATEFTSETDEYGELKAIKVLSPREINGETWYYRAIFSTESYTSFPLITETQVASKPKDLWIGGTEVKHGYRRVPGVVIKNIEAGRSCRGLPEFDKAAQEMAIEIALAEVDAASNHRYFGQPIYISDDAEETLRRLKLRIQVHEADSTADHPIGLKVVEPVALPSTHAEVLDRWQRNLAEHLGSSQSGDSPPPDTSSLTLRLINAKTISLAEKRWQSYVTDGLEQLFSSILVAAGVLGILTAVNGSDPETYKVSVARKQPYFSASPAEKVQSIAVAEGLIALGISREVALQEVYPDKSTEDIATLMEGVDLV